MANPIDVGAFLPTTDVYDIAIIQDIDVNSQEFKEFLVRLRQSTNNIALVTNIKDSGYYVLEEFVNSQLWFPNPALTTPNIVTPIYRQVYRRTYDIGALGAGVLPPVPHGLSITSAWSFTRIYGTASDSGTSSYYPIPFAGAAGAYISLTVDGTNINIDNNSGVTFAVCYVVLEFIKE